MLAAGLGEPEDALPPAAATSFPAVVVRVSGVEALPVPVLAVSECGGEASAAGAVDAGEAGVSIAVEVSGEAEVVVPTVGGSVGRSLAYAVPMLSVDRLVTVSASMPRTENKGREGLGQGYVLNLFSDVTYGI